MKKYFVFMLMTGLFLSVSCRNERNVPYSLPEAVNMTEYNERPRMQFDEKWNSMPPEVRALNMLLWETQARNVKIVDDSRLVLDMTPEQFLATGLPDSCYVTLVASLRNMDSTMTARGYTPEERAMSCKEYIEDMEDMAELAPR